MSTVNPAYIIDPYSVVVDKTFVFSNYSIRYVTFKTMDGTRYKVKGVSYNSTLNLIRVRINNSFYILKTAKAYKLGTPIYLKVEQTDFLELSLNWKSVSNASSYTLARKINNGEWNLEYATNISSNSYVDSNIDANYTHFYDTYYYKVVAVGDVTNFGTGDWSDQIEIKIYTFQSLGTLYYSFNNQFNDQFDGENILPLTTLS